MFDLPARRHRTTPQPLWERRPCDVCGLIEVEHPDRLGNDCYRRAVAAYFPLSAPPRQSYRSPLDAYQATVRGIELQVTVRPLWDHLRGKET